VIHLPITLEAAKASRMNMSKSSKTRDSRILVAAPRLAFPCNSQQLLYSDSTEFWKVQEEQTFRRAKNILNTNFTEEPLLHFTCDTFAMRFYFNSLWIVVFFLCNL